MSGYFKRDLKLAFVLMSLTAIFWCVWAAISGSIPSNAHYFPVPNGQWVGGRIDLGFSISRAWDVLAVPGIVLVYAVWGLAFDKLSERDFGWCDKYEMAAGISLLFGVVSWLLTLPGEEHPKVFPLGILGCIVALIGAVTLWREIGGFRWLGMYSLGLWGGWVFAFGIEVGGMTYALIKIIPVVIAFTAILGARVVWLAVPVWAKHVPATRTE